MLVQTAESLNLSGVVMQDTINLKQIEEFAYARE